MKQKTFARYKGRGVAACALGLMLAFGCATALSACDTTPQTDDPDTPEPPAEQTQTYTVTFASEEGTVYGTQTVEEGDKATLPTYVDRYGNAITQWYYKYESGLTETWSFAGYPVTEDMTLYAVESEGAEGVVYEVDATLGAYIDAMGGVEFGEGLYKSATVTVLSEAEQRYLLTMQVDKSQVTIYGVTCDTFIDPAATSTTYDGSASPVPLGSIGYYDADGNPVTEGVTYTLSAEGDLVNAPDPEGGSNYVQVRYVKEISMVLENVGAIEDLNELELTFYINSQVMGGQFCTDGPSAAMQPATLTINGLTELEETEDPEQPVSGITGAAIDENGHLILTLSDGSTLDAGLVKGEDGAQGVGISNITYSENTLHIYLTDGTHYAFDLSGASGPDLPDNVTETSASCTEDGVRLTYADASKQELLGTLTIERATGHTFEEGVCSVCGRAQADDMAFTINADGAGYTLTEYASHAWDTVVIPDTYEGLPVTAIADGATMMGVVLQSGVFKDHTEIERVVLGANVGYVGIGAFAGCSALTTVENLEDAAFGAFAFQNAALSGSVTVNGGMTEIPTYAFAGCASLTEVELPAGLQSIGASAFSQSGLASVSIPSSVTTIGASAFFETALTTVTVPASVTSLGASVFSGCAQLTSATISADIDALPNTTFSGCTSLTTVNSTEEGTADLSAYTEVGNSVLMNTAVKSIELSSSLTKTGSSAFSNCKQLVSVDFNGCTGVDFGNQTFLGSDALESVAVPANSTLGSSMFSGCSALRAVTLGEGIAEIPGNCFADCVSLESIAIPDSVTETGSNSFSGCTSLTQLTFGENSALTVLRGVSGTGLASLTIPASVTEINGCTSNYYLIEIVNRSAIELVSGSSENGSIAQYAENIVKEDPASGFVTTGEYTLYRDGSAAGEGWYVVGYNGSTEGELTLPASFDVGGAQVTAYGIHSRVFYGAAFTSVTVPASVTEIGAYAFANCASLASVTFAEGSALTSLGRDAFANCTALTALELPASLTEIGSNAFSGCYRLTSVELGGAQSIGESAFQNCRALKTLTIPASVTSIASNSFSGCTFAEVVNLAGEIENLPAAYSTVTNGADSRLVTEGDYTFLYVPAAGEAAAQAYLVSYNGSSNMVTLPASFTADGQQVSSYEIMAGAFAGAKLTSVTVPAAVTAVGDYAFYGSDVLKITFDDPSACKRLGEYSFAGSTLMFFNSDAAMALDLTGFAEVGAYAFSETTRLQSVVLAASVTSIGERAFSSSAVKAIEFAETRTEALALADYAFAYMYDLESIVIPGYVTELPANLLRGCSSLASVTLEEGVAKINNYVFRDCTSLTSLVIPASLTEGTSSAFGYADIEAYYYAGTAEQLAASSLPTAVKNGAYTYSEEAPINDGSFWHYAEDGSVAVWPMV